MPPQKNDMACLGKKTKTPDIISYMESYLSGYLAGAMLKKFNTEIEANPLTITSRQANGKIEILIRIHGDMINNTSVIRQVPVEATVSLSVLLLEATDIVWEARR